MLETDAQTVEAALKLAQAKFGNKLTLSEQREFQERAALVAAQKGLREEFTDHSINQLMNKYIVELEMQRQLEMVEKHLLRAGKHLKKYWCHWTKHSSSYKAKCSPAEGSKISLK